MNLGECYVPFRFTRRSQQHTDLSCHVGSRERLRTTRPRLFAWHHSLGAGARTSRTIGSFFKSTTYIEYPLLLNGPTKRVALLSFFFSQQQTFYCLLNWFWLTCLLGTAAGHRDNAGQRATLAVPYVQWHLGQLAVLGCGTCHCLQIVAYRFACEPAGSPLACERSGDWGG